MRIVVPRLALACISLIVISLLFASISSAEIDSRTIVARKIGVFSLAKLQAVIMAFAGLIAGIIYPFGGAIYDLLTTGSVNSGTAIAFLGLIGMPILFAAFGFIVGAIEAFIHNLVAGWFGGIEMDFKQ